MMCAPQSQLSNDSSIAQASAKQTSPVFHKTRMCRFHLLGVCNRGAACVFAHTKEELLPAPDFTCTRLCERLLSTGICKVKDCKFAHSKDELRSRKSKQSAPPAKVKQTGPRPAVTSAKKAADETVDIPATLPLTLIHLDVQADVKVHACNEDDGLDLEHGTWSRQSTEVADSQDLHTASPFSRFTSVDSEWQPLPPDATTNASEVPLSDVQNTLTASKNTLTESKLRGFYGGLPCEVRNTFLHFGPEKAHGQRVRAASVPRH
mmetsp:Transcript_2667/g.5868  ORF Transcript_2667/g.5868 Transcript_2667/m.5868 type:complete len:263 (-) Transcript_2667:99-887(-)